MIAPNSSRTLTRLLLPLTSAFFLYASSALASEHAEDAQAHAAALLSGKLTSHSDAIPKSATVSESRNDRSAFDAQMHARQLILGKAGGSRAPEKATAGDLRATSPSGVPGQQGGRAPADVQEMIRWLLQGRSSGGNVPANPLRAGPGTPGPVARRDL
jgi:hypothetical protein